MAKSGGVCGVGGGGGGVGDGDIEGWVAIKRVGYWLRGCVVIR